MPLEKVVEAFAGFMVLLSFVWLTVFVGANLFQQSFTGFCPAGIVLQKVFGFQPACQK